MRKWLAAFFVVLLILAFLPKIASTPLGKPLFVKALERKTNTQVTVDKLSLSWFGPQKFHHVTFTHDSVTGTVEDFEIDAPFWSFSGAFRLKNGSIVYRGGRVENIEGQIEGNDFELNGVTMQGHMSLKGQVYSKIHFNIQIDIQNFPLVVLDQRLDQILGPTLNLKGTVRLEPSDGRIDLEVSTANLKSHLIGVLSEHSVTLSEPLVASIRLTPELSSLLLKDANPLFLTGVEAKNPVTLRIEPNDFYCPLPFSLEKLNVGQATLNLGQVRCQNGKSLAAIITLLKATRLSEAATMNAWFTPITFHIHDGILDADRMDALLADSIHVCTWGSVNLIKDELHMNLGLPADTLKQSFGIATLSDSYVLKIPIRGTTKDPDIVKGPAAAQIAALIAGNQIPKKGFFGGLAELFSHPKEDKDIPPAKHPFPWE